MSAVTAASGGWKKRGTLGMIAKIARNAVVLWNRCWYQRVTFRPRSYIRPRCELLLYQYQTFVNDRRVDYAGSSGEANRGDISPAAARLLEVK